MTVVGQVDPRCARGLRVTYGLGLCGPCVTERASARWPGVAVGQDGDAVRIISRFRFELRLHREQVELWHRITRSADDRRTDRAEVEDLLGEVAAGACAHG